MREAETQLSKFNPSEEDSPLLGHETEKELDEVIAKLGFGNWQYLLIGILCIGSVADAMEVNLLTYLAPCVEEEWDLSGTKTSIITGAVFVGEIFGAALFGNLADHKGRRYSYAVSLLVIIMFGVSTYFTTNYMQLLCCRAMVGLGVGGAVVPFDYLAEIMPSDKRGMCLMFSNAMWGVGSLFLAGMAWAFLDDLGWRFLAFVCATPVAIAAILLFSISESPRWLLAQGRADEAVEALQYGAKLNKIKLEPFKLKACEVTRKEGGFHEIFKGSLLRPSVHLTVNWLSFGFTYFAIVSLISELLEVADSTDECSFKYKNIFISAISEPVFMFLSILFVEKSRIWTQAFCYISAGCFVLLLAPNLAAAWLTAFAFIARGTINIASSATWTVTPEFFPTEIRSSAHAFFYIIARLGAILSGFWVYSGFSTPVICIGISIWSILPGINSLFMEETAGLHLDDIQGSSVTSVRQRQRKKYSVSDADQSLEIS